MYVFINTVQICCFANHNIFFVNKSKPLINYRLFNYMISGKNDLGYCNTYLISISWWSFTQWYVAYIHISKISINSSIHLFCCDVQYITDEKRQKQRHIGLLMVLIIKGKMHHIYLHILSYVYITYSVTTKQIKQKKSWHKKSVTIILVRTCRLFGEGLYFIFFPTTFALYYSRGCRIQLNILNVSPNTVKPYNANVVGGKKNTNLHQIVGQFVLKRL